MPGILDMPYDQVFTIPVAAKAAGTGAGTEVPQAGAFVVPFNCTVVSAEWTPSAAVTASASHYTTLALHNYGAAGAGTTKPVTRSYAATNSVAQVSEAMTLDATPANRQCTAGDTLVVTGTDNDATGLALPAGTITLHVQVR